ncbi:immunoglobulin E-set [Paraphysoderma sedebokerense]|nr:immunoglobulin E-set [Paraphysoderma sedebokerense]KAI9138613.1 immunoglobulin E-set [Paraphysoderma sedebokerense]
MSEPKADDLVATETAGYKAPAQKTIEELAKLDDNDESLKKWKESLGLAAGAATTSTGPKDDPRKVVVLSLAMEVNGREDVVLDLSSPAKLEAVRKQPIIIKEGIEYRLKIKFRIQHELVSGLKYLQAVKRKGIRVDTTEEMLGSYGPNTDPYEKKFILEEAPSGMLARGTYDVKSKFVDDDKIVHLEWDWQFKIAKDWSDDKE